MQVSFYGDVGLRKLRAMRANTRPAGERAVAEVAARALRVMIAKAKAHSDTNRYVRGWELAHNQLPGVAPVGVSAVKPSRLTDQLQKRLEKQADYWREQQRRWDRNIANYETRQGHERWASYRQALRTQAKVREIAARAQQELDTFKNSPGAILVGGRAGKSRYRLGALATTRAIPLGGYSRLYDSPTGWVADIRNREPHARIVEYGGKTAPARLVVRTGLAAVRTIGARRVSAKYREEVVRGTGVK